MRSPLVSSLAAAVVVLLGTAASPRTAHADDAPAPVAVDVDSAEGRARLGEVNEVIGKNAAASRRWFWGWMAFYTGVEVYDAIVYATADERGVKTDAAVTLIKTGIGMVALAISAPPTLFASTLEIPANATKEERAALLAERQRLLEREAKSERFGHSILSHIGALAVNTAGFVYTLVKEDVPGRATFNFVSGVIVGELQIWTQPSSAMNAVDAQRVQRTQIQVVPTASKDGAGLMVLGRF